MASLMPHIKVERSDQEEKFMNQLPIDGVAL